MTRSPKLLTGVVIAAALAVAVYWVGSDTSVPTYTVREDVPLLEEAPSDEPALGFARERRSLSSKGDLHALLVFAHFKGEDPGPVPAYAADLFDVGRPGSFAHFYDEMSFGQLRVTGSVAPRVYGSRLPKGAYLATDGHEKGRFGRFCLEILRALDTDTDFADFDRDADGVVDYLFIAVPSTPRNFIKGGATGIAELGFEDEYVTDDLGADGEPVRIGGRRTNGTIFRYTTFSQTAGTMAHEFGHALGLADLYDMDYRGPEDDSAGIGKWGLMGMGTYGWRGDDGPNPLSAPNREWLGWLGEDNENLIEIDADTTDLYLADIQQRGQAVRIPVRSHIIDGNFYEEEYLLLEMRSRSHYYNRHLPAEGMLVWHIRPFANVTSGLDANSLEEQKVVDLVCADGLFADSGPSLGTQPRPKDGRDNLDFWAHDAAYRDTYAGNSGDAGDVFDGIERTELHQDSNPSSHFSGTPVSAAFRSLALRNLQRRGDGMVLDIDLPRWSGEIREEVEWIGDIFVDGDLTVAAGGRLTLYDKGTRVRFAGSDRLAGGQDPFLCELHLDGEVQVVSGRLMQVDRRGRMRSVRDAGVSLMAAAHGERWLLSPETMARLADVDGEVSLMDTVAAGAMLVDDPGVATRVEDKPVSAAPVEELRNYPNPFNAQTTISFSLSRPAAVQVSVYNSLGQLVRQLIDGSYPEGLVEVVWDGRTDAGQAAASGLYLCQLRVDDVSVQTHRMTLTR